MRRAKLIVRLRRRRIAARLLIALTVCAVLLAIVLWRLEPSLVNFVHSL